MLFIKNIWPSVEHCYIKLILLKTLSCHMWRGNYQLWYNLCCAIDGLFYEIYCEYTVKAAWAVILTRSRNTVLLNSDFVRCYLFQDITNLNSKVTRGDDLKKLNWNLWRFNYLYAKFWYTFCFLFFPQPQSIKNIDWGSKRIYNLFKFMEELVTSVMWSLGYMILSDKT